MRRDFTTWLAFIINLIFAAVGVFLLFRDNDTGMALVITFFFGFGAVVLGAGLIGKRRFQKRIDTQAVVTIAGNRPFYLSRLKYNAMGLALAFLGALLIFAVAAPWHIRAIGMFLIVVGAVLLLLMNIPGWRRGLMFAFEGIWFLERWGRYCIHWDNLASVSAGDLHGNTAIFLVVKDENKTLETLHPKSIKPSKAGKKILKRFSRNLSFAGAHELFFPEMFGLDSAWLYKAIEGYINDPSRREGLIDHGKLPSLD